MASRAFSEALRLLPFVLLWSTLSSCKPIGSRRHTLEDISVKEKRQGGYFSVLGVAGVTGDTVYPRLEIRDLEKNHPDQWNVYLLSLRRFQLVDQNDRLSYYQISGIHGRPYIPWDGVHQGDGGSGGYCAHGSNIFPTWHRPYLALYEEILYLQARQAVNEFPAGELKDRYRKALATLRMPYWDSAAVPPSGEGVLPWSVQRQTVDIVMPNGTNTVPNPLFSYQFHPVNQNNEFDSGKWSTWTQTLRDPSSEEANAASRNDLVALQLDSNRPNLQSRVYNVLSMQKEYTAISNDLTQGDSLESVHDTIHNTVGSDGHMSLLAYSAFDPVFWLHHTNVDRMFAIWQTLNPGSYVTALKNPYATFTYPGRFTADASTSLTPFHRDDSGNFWTSESVRSPSAFAYTYPELLDLPDNDTSVLVSRVNALYGTNASPSPKRSVDNEKEELVGRSLSSRGIAGAPNFSGQRQYIANIKVHKFGLDGSFNVYVFLGNQPGPDPKTWAQEASFIGVVGILSQPGFAADESKKDQEANGAVPLTAALEAHVRSGALSSLNEVIVEEYLKQNLRWRISKTDGTEIAPDAAPGFQLSVIWAEIQPAASVGEFPTVKGEYQVLVDATNGQPGGFGSADVL